VLLGVKTVRERDFRREIMPKKKAEATELIIADDTPQLPGGIGIDRSLLTQAVREINTMYTRKSVETSCVIGEYLLENFFEGDIGNFDKWGDKHETFRELTRLAKEGDGVLYMSYSALWYSVRILEQVRALPADIGMALPVTHQKMLIPMKDLKKKEKLAKLAVSKSMTSRQFKAEVQKAREKDRAEKNTKVSSGRPPHPVFVTGMKQLIKAVDLATSKDVEDENFKHYKVKEAKELMNEVDNALAKLERLQEKLKVQFKTMS